MSTEIESLERFYAAINRNDMQAITTDFDPQIVRVEPKGFPTAGTYRGIAAVQEHVATGRGTWAEGTCRPERYLVHGDKVVVYLHALVRLKEATDWIDARFADGFAFRDGRITEYRSFAERADALQWAGIADGETRPPFIVSTGDLPERTHVYPQSDEPMGPVRSAGSAAGLVRLGINLQRLTPGSRSSWPHAESDEEEFVYVIEGEVDAWIDGDIHRMVAGDFAGFPAGTGICHCFINNSERDALLLVGGEAPKPANRIFYPLNPSRRADLEPAEWWHDAPARPLGAHDGLPDRLRQATQSKGKS
jgi:uncharacterized cupin superfamily protein/ketosteroid isomerase-like protein